MPGFYTLSNTSCWKVAWMLTMEPVVIRVDLDDVGCSNSAQCISWAVTMNSTHIVFNLSSRIMQIGILWMHRKYGAILPNVPCWGNCIWPQFKVLPIIWAWGIILHYWCSFISCTNGHLQRITGTECKQISFYSWAISTTLYHMRVLSVWIAANSLRNTLLAFLG